MFVCVSLTYVGRFTATPHSLRFSVWIRKGSKQSSWGVPLVWYETQQGWSLNTSENPLPPHQFSLNKQQTSQETRLFSRSMCVDTQTYTLSTKTNIRYMMNLYVWLLLLVFADLHNHHILRHPADRRIKLCLSGLVEILINSARCKLMSCTPAGANPDGAKSFSWILFYFCIYSTFASLWENHLLRDERCSMLLLLHLLLLLTLDNHTFILRLLHANSSESSSRVHRNTTDTG